MAVQVSYPGVYIEEFTPGAPIQGVGTNTAAFVGTATRGPINVPTLIQSWDAFVAVFGGFIDEQPPSYLAPAVRGFFLNGGTTCYILRVGTGVMSVTNLDSREGVADPALVARALAEGPGGDAITVEVLDSSKLTTALSSAGLLDTDLAAWHAETGVTGIDANRVELTVVDNAGFEPGDSVLVSGDGNSQTRIVDSTQGSQTIVLVNPLDAVVNINVNGAIRTADISAVQRTLRLNVPPPLRLNQVLPRGATIRISLGATSDIRTVESSGGDTITLTEGVGSLYSMANAANLPRVASLEFDLIVDDSASGDVETFEQLGMSAHYPNYWATAVVSNLIQLENPPQPPSPAPNDPRPDVGIYNLGGGQEDDRAFALADLRNDPNKYLDLLKPIDEIAILAIPGETVDDVQQAMRDHCEALYDRFAILDSIKGSGITAVTGQLADVRSALGFAALYYPWIVARNPLTGSDELWPPSGHIAGIYARTDAQRGVHKAPANANIRGALGLEFRLTNEEQGPLNLQGLNILRVFPGQSQPLVWGARTTATTIDNNWQYVNIRRLMLFIEESVEEGIKWAVFEPNNLQLWQKLKRSITEFLTRVWRDGALFGATAEEAFYVRIDEILNPPSERRLGRLNIEIGVAPVYPAEFLIVRIGLWDGGAEVNEI